MTNGYSADDLLDFLTHASKRGLVPAATAQALAVACRNVFGVLDPDERNDIRSTDIDGVIKRFTNKRARDFSPASLKEYDRRVHRAVDLFLKWRESPADFSVRTRTTRAPKKDRNGRAEQVTVPAPEIKLAEPAERNAPQTIDGYQSAFPVRPGRVVTIANIPYDLTAAEAERLASFVRMLAAQ